jgi:nucleoside-diphosphate-sugar epimerase
MRVLITGGTGFIGSRLALRCAGRGDEVLVLAQENTEAESANREALESAGVELRLGSVTDPESVRRAMEGVDLVVHLAATQHEMNVPDEKFQAVNVEGTRNVLDGAAEAHVRRVVHGSTIGVYGKPNGVLDETSPVDPDNIYGVTKLEGERLALDQADRVPVVAVRIPEVYGPGDRRLLKLFKAIDRGAFFMIGGGRNLHHLIYVDDLVDGLLAAAEAPDTPGELFLLAGPEPVSTDRMVLAVAEAVGKPGPRFRAPLWPFVILATAMELTLRPLGIQPPLHRRRLDFFRKSFELSAAKARRVFGFSPSVSFEEGARRTAEWYRAEGLL